MLRFNQYPGTARWGLSALMAGTLVLAACSRAGQGPGPDGGPSPTSLGSPHCVDGQQLYRGVYRAYLDGPTVGNPVDRWAMSTIIGDAGEAIIDHAPARDSVVAEVAPGTSDVIPRVATNHAQDVLETVLSQVGQQSALVGSEGRITTNLEPGDPTPDQHQFTVALTVLKACQ